MNEQKLIDLALSLGAYQAAVIPVSRIHFDKSFRSLCESNACGNFGMCWMCPPDVGDIVKLIEEAKTFQSALAYQTVGELADGYDIEGMLEAGNRHNRLAQKISGAFASLPFGKTLHLGAGGCRVCPVCAKRTGGPCRFPDRAMASLEAYGVAVSELAEACGMKYVNGQSTVTYFGAFPLPGSRRLKKGNEISGDETHNSGESPRRLWKCFHRRLVFFAVFIQHFTQILKCH